MSWLKPKTRLKLELERFEFVPAGAGLALLRLSGRWSPPRPAPAALRLAVQSGGRRKAFAPLPGPALPGEAGEWRAGFSVPSELLAGGSFVLEAEGLRVELPPPAERALRTKAQAAPAAVLESRRAAVLDAKLQAASRRIRELERALGAARAETEWQRKRSVALQAELRSLVEAGQRSEGALERQVAVLNRARAVAGDRSAQVAELERRLSGIRDRLLAEQGAPAPRSPDRARAAGMRLEAERRSGELDAAERRLTEIRDSLLAAAGA